MKQLILLLSLAACSAQEFIPLTTPFPSNKPKLDPGLDLVMGVFPPIPPKPIPPNRKQPALSKADIVMAATDKIGILVNNLAQDLAVDLSALINSLPSDRATRAMEGQFAVRDQDYPEEER